MFAVKPVGEWQRDLTGGGGAGVGTVGLAVELHPCADDMATAPRRTSSEAGVIRTLSSHARLSIRRTVPNPDGTWPPGEREKSP
jgi:hypothetical protein